MPCLGLRTGLSKRNLILDVCVACCICEIEVHELGVMQWWVPEVSEKTKEIEWSKSPRSLDMKYYLVTGGLSSVPEPSNKSTY